jgi:hypothetical protein
MVFKYEVAGNPPIPPDKGGRGTISEISCQFEHHIIFQFDICNLQFILADLSNG